MINRIQFNINEIFVESSFLIQSHFGYDVENEAETTSLVNIIKIMSSSHFIARNSMGVLKQNAWGGADGLALIPLVSVVDLGIYNCGELGKTKCCINALVKPKSTSTKLNKLSTNFFHSLLLCEALLFTEH